MGFSIFIKGDKATCYTDDLAVILDPALNKGKIKNTGFSSHDNLDSFEEVIDFYP